MGFVSIVVIAVALAMDAFAVAVVTGLSLAVTRRRVFRLAFHFGLFQALMPTLGWLAGNAIHRYIAAFDHWVAFGLLAAVGGKMIVGALSQDEAERAPVDPTRGWDLVLLSVATSIDALAVGLSLAMLGSAIMVPAAMIGVITAAITAAGMLLGRRVGAGWGPRIEVVGGIVLVAIGVKIVAEHML
ncbi:MAG: manganese efflux pump MntP family protein [Bacteroidales bacterium]